jgi:RNA polymerase sigma factor (sigma-70 family)
VHRVAINLANSYFRRRAAWGRARVRLDTEARRVPDDADLASAVAVRGAVAALPKRLREVLVLRYFSDLSVREVAAVTGRPEGSVKRLTSEAIDRLRGSGLIERRESAADAC